MSARSDCERRMQRAQADIAAERDTYSRSRAGLDDMYKAMQKQCETEIRMRQEVEQDRDRLIAQRQQVRYIFETVHECLRLSVRLLCDIG